MYLFDACVLIDFMLVDIGLLAVVNRDLGDVHVPMPVLRQVDQLDDVSAAYLGLTVFEPDVGEAFEARSLTSTLGFEDCLCLVTARNRALTVVTNDSTLRRECEGNNLPVCGSLGLLVRLVEAGCLSRDTAKARGMELRVAGARFSRGVWEEFLRQLEET